MQSLDEILNKYKQEEKKVPEATGYGVTEEEIEEQRLKLLKEMGITLHEVSRDRPKDVTYLFV